MKRFLLTLAFLTFVFPLPACKAQMLPAGVGQQQTNNGSGGGGGCSAISGAEVDISAGCTESYSGTGQTVTNMGSSGTNCDFYLGATGSIDGDEPTFSTDRFSWTGTSQFLSTKSSDSCTIIDTLHYTAYSGRTIGIVFHHIDGGGLDYHFGNTASTNRGIGSYHSGTEAGGFEQHGDTAEVGYSNIFASTTYVNDTTYCLIVSYDASSTTDNVRHWLNSTTKVVDSFSMNSSATAAQLEWYVGSTSEAAAASLPSGAAVLEFFVDDTFLDDADIAAIHTVWEGRHAGLDCTP